MESFTAMVGVAALVLGAVGATVTQRQWERHRKGPWLPLVLIPFGVLLGGGAALVRQWDLPISMTVGAFVVPLVAIIGRWWQVRRANRRADR